MNVQEKMDEKLWQAVFGQEDFDYISVITPVRFAELEFSKHRVYIKDFDSSLLGRI
jgi:hypothetical protein